MRKLKLTFLTIFLLIILHASSYAENIENKGITLNIGLGGAVSLPRGAWQEEIIKYLDSWHPAAHAGANITLRVTDRNLKKVVGIIPVPIVSIIAQFEYSFNGHFSDVAYTGGNWESELKHRYMTVAGGIQVYPLRFIRFYSPFVEYQIGWINSRYVGSAGDSNNGEFHDDLDGVYQEYDNANGLIHKISIGHDFQINDNFGIIVKSRWSTTSSGTADPLKDHNQVPNYYRGKIKSTDICLDFYVSFL